ncbi:MAG: hypothetical protein M1812_002524 [Candelaria pacifica]|nr:MAG: hypothetical protein M1812_002524 [Candelaria pacifica]
MAAHSAQGNALHANFDVDYVISYRFADTDKAKASAGFERLIRAIADVGLATEVRNGNNCSVLVFVKIASEKHLVGEVYRSRVQDWLYGIRPAAPPRPSETSTPSEPLTESDRLRLVYLLLTKPRSERGAGITPKEGDFECVESIFALHDHTFNKEWIKKWSTSYFLQIEDLDQIREKFGEKIAFYFAFLQSYFLFLVFPAAFGFSAWVLLGTFSPIYAVVSCLWCVTFVEYWKRQEIDLGVRWNCRNVSALQTKRRDFKYEKEAKDPVTGETMHVFPEMKRLQRQLLQIPFAIVAVLALGTLIATCFGIEVFISEVYNGPLKWLLVYLPTGLLTTLVPTITTLLTSIATRLTDYENWETTDTHEAAMIQKIFVLNFITSYLGIFLTAFVYVPFGSIVVPYLDVFSLTMRPFAENEGQLKAPKVGSFEINPSRLRKQVIYFTVTAQIVNLALETVMPYIKRKVFHKYQEVKTERASKRGGVMPAANANDPPGEEAFLARVRNEAELDVYDVATDLREMVVQFGYLSLFSIVWPLTPVSFLINNWVELRSDAIKICIEMQRPTPWRADSIGPWLETLGFLAWLGSITTSALAYMFSGDGLGPDGTPATIKGWALLLTVFFSEHIYLLVRTGIRIAISKIDSPGKQKEEGERYLTRKRYLEQSLEEEGESALHAPAHGIERIDRRTLEEEARYSSLHNSKPEDHFWSRQRGWQESVIVGVETIQKSAPSEGKKQQ